MNITELSVRRPTAIIMLMVLFIGLGMFGYMNLGADLLPSANTPIISILDTYPGAGSEEIEKDIIKPIEDAVSGINGIDRVRSYSGDGFGHIILQFTMSTDTVSAVLDVQQALDSIASKLPEDASRPIMRKYDINMKPALIMSISGSLSYEELYDKADEIKHTIEKLQGVGNVSLEGVVDKQLCITIDKTMLEYYGLSANTIINFLQAQNINVPAGQIEQQSGDVTVRLQGELQNIDEIKGLRLPLPAGGTVRLDEIAKVELKFPEQTEIVKLSGKPSIGIFVQKQSNANIVKTANTVKEELQSIEKDLPSGMDIVIANDSTTFINSSLDEAGRNVLEGILTTAIILLIFLRRWRSSLIVLIAIPLSMIATLFMMYMMKFTLNLVSLLGLAMCIGILVDDSIVILENIHRHISLGKDPREAAIEGRKEIGMAAIAITLCDVVVFTPVAFMNDLVGQFFRQFGLTVVFATLFSLFVSFTVTPMMASRMFKKGDAKAAGIVPLHNKPGKTGGFNSFFENVIKSRYKSFLIWALGHRWRIVILVSAGVILSLLLIPVKYINTEFMPVFDQSRLILDVSLKPGSSLGQTDDKVKTVENYIGGLPGVQDYFTTVGSNNDKATANIIVKLEPKNKRQKTQAELAKEIRTWGRKLPGAKLSVTETSIIDRTSIDGTKPVILNITGNDTSILRTFANNVEELVKTVPGIVDVDNSIRSSQNEINVKIDRLAASAYGLTEYDAASVMRTAIEGSKAGVFRKDGDEYDIIVKFSPEQMKTVYDIQSLKVTGKSGQQVYLNQIAKITQTDSPVEIMRLNRQQVVTIAANIEGRVLGSVNKDIQEKLKTLKTPNGCNIEFGGDQSNMSSAFGSLVKVLVVSILLVYMILAVLYESFLTPFIRMLSLPCGIIGALTALAITGKTLNLLSMIGLIMLDGLVSKNGTLLIDYTNTLVKRGIPLKEALVEAGITRLRPIIMTSVTMIVGMLPLALSLGDGSEVKSGMAVVLIGGLIASTILSPILLPVVYTLIDDLRNSVKKKKDMDEGEKVKILD